MRKPDSINRPLIHYLGRRIRARRKAIESSPSVFADRHDYDRNLWGRIERGQQNVSVSTLAKVAAALGTTMGELLAGLEEDVRRDADRIVATALGAPRLSARRPRRATPAAD
jgi:transcriptional regulator with XRE-family HTH domain